MNAVALRGSTGFMLEQCPATEGAAHFAQKSQTKFLDRKKPVRLLRRGGVIFPLVYGPFWPKDGGRPMGELLRVLDLVL